jgi:RNA polymerase I-specific transcription initiation factor RRN7
MFPLIAAEPTPPEMPLPNSWTSHHLKSSTSSIQHTTIDISIPNRDLPLMPGEKVRSYDTSDITGTLPGDYEAVINAAADIVGVLPVEVGRVVEGFENRLLGMRKKGRRGLSLGVRSRSHSRARRPVYEEES